MEKLTAPGFEEVDEPLVVARVSQVEGCTAAFATAGTEAVQLTVELPETLTRNDPCVLPGAVPATVRNCDPEGFSVIVGLDESSRVTETLADPADEVIVIVLW